MSLFLRSARFRTSSPRVMSLDIFLVTRRLVVKLEEERTLLFSIKGADPMYRTPKDPDHGPRFLIDQAP